MSIPAENDAARFERFRRAIRLVPFAVALLLAALWIAGAPAEVPDLRLSAPVVVRPGSSIGVRAWQIDRDAEGYTVIRAPATEVELRNEAGLVIASVPLSASLVHGVEGTLAIPEDLEGAMTLTARATIDDGQASVDRTLYVREGIDSRLPKGRSVNAFQVYELEPLRVYDALSAPKILDPRIEEGACVPDLRCTLVVWVGDWSGRLRVRSRAGADVEGDLSQARDGFARFELVVRGQEGRLAVEALDARGTVLASREVRLPVVPGGLVLRATQSEAGPELEWESLGGPVPILVDVFEDHRWVQARSARPGELVVGALAPGVWRIQARTDLFSDNTAGVAYVVIPNADSDPLRDAADAVLATADRDGLDPLAADIVEGAFGGDSYDAERALFAAPSFGVIAVGPGVSARIGVDQALAREQDLRRWLAAGAILLLGFVVSMILLRVELTAQARARRLLEELDDQAPPPPRRTPAGRGLWAFVLFVFVVMAVLALSKRWF